jgi:hypothetical protein
MQDPAVDDDIHMPIAVVNGEVFELRVLLTFGNKALNNGLFKTLSLHEQKNGSLGSIYKDVTNFTQIQDLESPTN